MPDILIISLVAAAAGFAQGLAGFGSVLFALPALASVFALKTVIPLVSLFGLCINFILVFQLRKQMDWRKILPLSLPSLLGIPLGVWLLRNLPAEWLKLAIGLVLVLFALQALSGRLPHRELGRGWALLAGFCSGILGGGMGTNGPPILVYVNIQPWTKDEVKSTLVGFFAVAGVLVCSTFAATGMVTVDVLKLWSFGLPALVLGIWCGSAAYRRLGGDSYRKMMLMLLVVLGGSMIWQGMPSF